MPSFQRVELEGVDDLRKDPKHGGYYLRAYTECPGGKKKEFYRSLGTRNLREALERAKDLRAQIARLDPTRELRTYEEVARACFDVRLAKNAKKRASTVNEARLIYEKYLIPGLGKGGRLIDAVTDSVWNAQYEAWKQSTDRKSFFNIRKYAVQVDNFAHRQGWKKNRCDFEIDDPTKREGVVLTDEQFALALDACSYWYKNGQRLSVPLKQEGGPDILVPRPKVGRDLREGIKTRRFLKCGRYMGMRRSEITRLTIEKVDLANNCIVLEAEDTKTGSKTGRGRTFAIAPECRQDLEDAVAEAKAAGTIHLFPNRTGDGPVERRSINRVVARLAFAIGVMFRPHDLRHTFVTIKLFVEKVDPMSVAIYVGMSLQVMQDTYLHPTVDSTRHVVFRLETPKHEIRKVSELGNSEVASA